LGLSSGRGGDTILLGGARSGKGHKKWGTAPTREKRPDKKGRLKADEGQHAIRVRGKTPVWGELEMLCTHAGGVWKNQP